MFLAKADLEVPDASLRSLGSASDSALGIDAALLDAARGAFALPPGARFERFSHQGTFHRLYVIHAGTGSPQLLRIAALGGEPWVELMALEAGVARLLRERSLPVPACEFRALAHGAALRGAQRVDLVEGYPANAKNCDEGAMAAALEQAARFLPALHRIQGEGFGPLALQGADGVSRPRGAWGTWLEFLQQRLPEHVRACVDIGAMTMEEARRIEALLRDAGWNGVPSLLHGDPGGANFIFRDARLAAVIDWEDALLGDPLFDLASLCTFQPARRHAAILRGYGLEPVAGSAESRRFWLYFLRIALAKTVHRHRFQYRDAPGRPAASGRIQLALAQLSSPAHSGS